MLVDEGQDIFRHGCVVMAGVVRRFSMVSKVLYGVFLFNMAGFTLARKVHLPLCIHESSDPWLGLYSIVSGE